MSAPSFSRGPSAWTKLFAGISRRERCALTGEDFENQKIRGMETCHSDMMQVFIALRNVTANQGAKLFHRDTQLMSRFDLVVLSLARLLGGKGTCIHGLNAF